MYNVLYDIFILEIKYDNIKFLSEMIKWIVHFKYSNNWELSGILIA